MYLCSCGTWDLPSSLQQGGSSSLTEDQTQAPSTGSTEAWPLDHQGSAETILYVYTYDSRKQNFQHCPKQFLMHKDIALSGGVASMFPLTWHNLISKQTEKS